MVRFKNRYLLVELAFEDGRVDDSLGLQDVLGVIRVCAPVVEGV